MVCRIVFVTRCEKVTSSVFFSMCQSFAVVAHLLLSEVRGLLDDDGLARFASYARTSRTSTRYPSACA